jgi:2'-5' RNA ligase
MVGDGARIFLALEIPDSVRAMLKSLQKELSPHATSLRLVNPELMHVTVRFLGSVPAVKLDAVERAASGAALQVPPFRLSVAAVGMFPERGLSVRVIWAGLVRDVGFHRLQQLFQCLEGKLEIEGFARERRPLSAHITLARVRDNVRPDEAARLRSLVEQMAAMSPHVHGSFVVSRLTVMRSDLTSAGPRYTPLVRVRLTGADTEDLL